MSDVRECPSCGADLTNKWIGGRVTWPSGEEHAEVLVPCPVCEWNLAGGDPPELVSGGVSLFDE